MEGRDVLAGNVPFGLRVPRGREGQFLNPESGNRVEGEALSQVAGILEATILASGSDFQRMGEPFGRPAQFVPVENGCGRCRGRPRLRRSSR